MKGLDYLVIVAIAAASAVTYKHFVGDKVIAKVNDINAKLSKSN